LFFLYYFVFNISTTKQIRIGKKPGKFEKAHGNGKKWFLPGKMGKTGKAVFFSKYLFKKYVKSLANNDKCFDGQN
jgi:hypothetical protein